MTQHKKVTPLDYPSDDDAARENAIRQLREAMGGAQSEREARVWDAAYGAAYAFRSLYWAPSRGKSASGLARELADEAVAELRTKEPK